MSVDEQTVRKVWQAEAAAQHVAAATGRPAPVQFTDIFPELDHRRRSIWELTLQDGDGEPLSVMVKIHHRPSRRRSAAEVGVYRHLSPRLHKCLPQVYTMASSGDGSVWTFMEHIPPITGRLEFTPETFLDIIPRVADLHAATYGEPGTGSAYGDWLPEYDGHAYRQRKEERRQKTLLYLARAMSLEHLEPRLRPHFATVTRVLEEAPLYLEPLQQAGRAVVHGDLHTHNICCHDLDQRPWDLRFIDWESARWAPVWFELAVMVEILIDFRPDWWGREEQVRQSAVSAYVEAMAQRGVHLPAKAMTAYQAAYYERTLERGLYTQLRRELDGRRGQLLPRYLEKLTQWGRDLGLVET